MRILSIRCLSLPKMTVISEICVITIPCQFCKHLFKRHLKVYSVIVLHLILISSIFPIEASYQFIVAPQL